MQEKNSTKRCVKCGSVLPLDSFYRDKSRPAGRGNTCKECFKKYKREYDKSPSGMAARERYETSDNGSETRGAWLKSDRGKAVRKAYTENNREVFTKSRQRFLSKRPWYTRCKNAVQHEVRMGRLAPASSESCESGPNNCEGRHHYHHDSYESARWLDVRCLCRKHHEEWHRENTPTPFQEE